MTAKYLSKEKVDKLWKRLGSCDLCGHGCRIDRLAGERGVCDSGQKLKISSAFPHFGEEDVLVGKRGSGAIFLSGCSMGCVYCQNWHISQQGKGEEMGEEKLAEIMLQLQQKGCHNINLVTPTHFIPQLVKALFIAKKRDLHVPIVYNTSGYDNPEMIKCLDGIIDIYMPDIKYSSNENGRKYSKVEKYWCVVRENIKETHRQVGDLKINDEGVAEQGLLIRHLVLPNNIAGSKKVLGFIANISKNSYINIMAQYRSAWKAHKYPKVDRLVNKEEYRKVKKYAEKLGLVIH